MMRKEIDKSSEEWKSSTKRETLLGMEQELRNLIETAPPDQKEAVQKELGYFRTLFSRFLHAKTTIEWKKIQPLPDNAIIPYKELKLHDPSKDLVSDRLSKLVVVKLNGGLGTSMGCKGPKSMISVRNDLTFLDLTLQQIQVWPDLLI
ncbi:hypothetical protein LOAG_09471 [Loa loa]|uniref:UTP--glucose-1-phosphate uridylyltransferase n=1 Tax=Loa loa TaxID=7209 RepID=A0A1S0TRU3_LOALO|nr:hypothetical protein LOAG_09471 [Loa loa]EFO19026.2 hypothetical protein LOAG_09471 [Loa loa]